MPNRSNDEPLVVFESVDLPPDPPAKPRTRTETKSEPRPRPAEPSPPKRRKRRPPAAKSTAPLPPRRSLPPRTLSPRQDDAPDPKPARRKKKRRRRSRRDTSADIGLAMMVVLTLFMLAPALLLINVFLEQGQTPRPVDYTRWAITAALLFGLWRGSEIARLLWVGMLAAVTLLFGGVTAVAKVGDDPRWMYLAVVGGVFGLGTLVLWAVLYSPCFTAFLARRRGER